MPKSSELELLLRYSGPEVDDGTMSLDDLVPVLQGFAGAYGKVAGFRGIPAQHKLRLVSIRPGSASLILDVWEMIGKNSQNLQAVAELVSAVMAIIAIVVGVIRVKKHVKKKPYSTRLAGLSNSITIVNSDNVSISVPLEVFNVLARPGNLWVTFKLSAGVE